MNLDENKISDFAINLNLEKEPQKKCINLNIKKTEPVTLIYNTEDYQTKTFGIKIIAFNEEKEIINKLISPDKIIIWKYANEYGLVDIYSATIDIPNDIQEIMDILRRNYYNDIFVNLLFYPDINDTECYIKLYVPDTRKIESSVTNLTSSRRILSQIAISSEIDIYCDGEWVKNINSCFEDIIQNTIELTEEEISLINNLYNKQLDPNWFKVEPVQEIKRKKEPIFEKKPEKQTTTQTSEDEIFDPSVLKVIEGSKDPQSDMEKIIGLNNVKHEIEKLKYTLEYKEERKKRGIIDQSATSMHMCFYGSPGTGKTTVARIMTGLLYRMGYIKKNQCVEINGLEFKGGYVGQTEIKTKAILDYSYGGILFVDEAYALCGNDGDAYGKEAVNTFIKEMEDNRDNLIIIFAGYEDAMENFLNTNPGFRSRINKYFKFEDYTTNELTEIFIKQLKRKHLKIDKDALEKCVSIIKGAQSYNDFGNGRFITNLIEKIEEDHILNVASCNNFERLDTLKLEDINDKTIENLLNSLKK